MLWGSVLLGAIPSNEGGGGAHGAGNGSDFALVAAAQRGDVEAFAKLHARYYRRIYHLAYLKTNNASDAEDVASETFIRALAGLRQFRLTPAGAGGHVSFYPWLHRIAVNLIIDSARQRPPSGVVSLDAPLLQGVRALLGDQIASAAESSPQEIVERHEVQQLVRSAIASLPPDQGDALVYRFLGELSAQEMAPLLQRSESAVKSLLHRAVVALRAEIARRLDAIERLETGRSQSEEKTEEVMQGVGRTSAHSSRYGSR
jgi:RNA polymerase sigma-70 factor (ECF subfamily)